MKHPDQSPESRQRQLRIQELLAEIKRTQTTVKSLRTRWRKMGERIESMTRNTFGQGIDVTLRSARLAEQLLELLPQINPKWLTAEERFAMEVMEPEFETFAAGAEGMEEHETEFDRYRQERAADQSRAEAKDPFAEFRTAPEKTEQRDIRKLYLELSKQFHPDKARNAFEQRRFTEIQQRITRAFEIGDTQALLELRDSLLADPEEASVAGDHDAEQARIEQLERELALLQAQKERLSEDIANLRASPYGQALSETDRIVRDTGFDMEESLVQQRALNEMMEGLVEAFRDCLRLQDRSPLLDELEILPPEFKEPDTDELLESLYEVTHEEDVDSPHWFDDEDEEDDEYNFDFAFESPFFRPTNFIMDLDLIPAGWEKYSSSKFKPGISVKLKLPTTLDLPRPERFSGLLLRTIRNRELEETFYLVQIDESYFKGMDAKALDNLFGKHLNYNPNTGIWLRKQELVALPPKQATPHGNTRRRYYEWAFKHRRDHEPEQCERLVHILSRLGPKVSDLEHWDGYLRGKLTFPLAAKLRPEFAFGEWADKKMRLQGLDSLHPFLGILVVNEENMILPLHYYDAVSKRNPAHQVLEDYQYWAEACIELFN